ncbi:MAG: imidazole glycerol phosphate synthase subunit HisH [Hyphomicrobiaceae bacterium]|nr:imidazole glycerol phosphate synthase subunit HisH [Hyphomicrobiaceae bacterium]
MSELVTIIDYGSGNLRSAEKAFERAARELELDTIIEVTNDVEKVLRADRIMLPGVGAFADCRAGLYAIEGMHAALEQRVIRDAVPFLGVCVGMQLMAERGLEKGTHQGLGWIHGDVVRITPSDPDLKIPHMGWNNIDMVRSHPLFEGIKTGPDGLHAYFVHSYHLAVAHPNELVATADYGGPVTAVVARDNMLGTQFHPEKSQTLGLTLIGNFLRWKP